MLVTYLKISCNCPGFQMASMVEALTAKCGLSLPASCGLPTSAVQLLPVGRQLTECIVEHLADVCNSTRWAHHLHGVSPSIAACPPSHMACAPAGAAKQGGQLDWSKPNVSSTTSSSNQNKSQAPQAKNEPMGEAQAHDPISQANICFTETNPLSAMSDTSDVKSELVCRAAIVQHHQSASGGREGAAEVSTAQACGNISMLAQTKVMTVPQQATAAGQPVLAPPREQQAVVSKHGRPNQAAAMPVEADAEPDTANDASIDAGPQAANTGEPEAACDGEAAAGSMAGPMVIAQQAAGERCDQPGKALDVEPGRAKCCYAARGCKECRTELQACPAEAAGCRQYSADPSATNRLKLQDAATDSKLDHAYQSNSRQSHQHHLREQHARSESRQTSPLNRPPSDQGTQSVKLEACAVESEDSPIGDTGSRQAVRR